MEAQDGGLDVKTTLLDVAKTAGKLQLPLSCDPPGLDNPPKQFVWIVGIEKFYFL
jgi:hypothetical protein